jgi:hypothetical protein
LAHNTPVGTFRDASANVLSPAAERYKKSITNCDAPESLLALLKVIIMAGLAEREFSYLYSMASERRKALEKAAEKRS